MQELLPSDPADERLASAVAAMGTELKRWADMSNMEVSELELEDEIRESYCSRSAQSSAASSRSDKFPLLRCWSTERVISAFTTHLFLGTTIDYEIMDDISLPIPGALPMYPYFPAWLLPTFHRYLHSLFA